MKAHREQNYNSLDKFRTNTDHQLVFHFTYNELKSIDQEIKSNNKETEQF